MNKVAHENLEKIAADWKDFLVPAGTGFLSYLLGRGLGLGQLGSILLGGAGAFGGHYARKNWNNWFPQQLDKAPDQSLIEEGNKKLEAEQAEEQKAIEAAVAAEEAKKAQPQVQPKMDPAKLRVPTATPQAAPANSPIAPIINKAVKNVPGMNIQAQLEQARKNKQFMGRLGRVMPQGYYPAN